MAHDTLPTTLVTLLTGAIDYAGLFPPAGLDLVDAVANFAEYRQSDDAWALGRLVVPASRLLEVETALARLEPAQLGTIPWDLSVTFGADWSSDLHALDAYRTSGATNRAGPDTIEARVADPAAVKRLAALIGGDKLIFGEVTAGPDAAEVLGALGAAGLAAKLRMGGTEAAAFPDPGFVADFLVTAAKLRLPFKATAGLHHPIRGRYPLTYEPGAARGLMYGYLNVLLGAGLAWDGAPAALVVEALLEDDRSALHIDDEGIRWREVRVSRRSCEQLRAASFRGWGSCSFREPMEELPTVLER